MKKLYLPLLATIVILGLFLRIWQLGNLPSILNRDEAALAYNGLLLSQSGRDEFGRFLPLTFESFGDYKLPGYPYLLATLFKFLPINDATVRLPSAIAGTLLIVVVTFLAKNFGFKRRLSLAMALIIALNPVFIFYSRIAFEANVALTLFVTSLVFLTSSKPTLKTDLLGAGFALLAICFYNTPLLLLPFVGLAIIIFRGFKQPKKWLGIGLGLAAVFLLAYTQLTNLTAQKSSITWFDDETTWDESVKYYQQFSGLSQKLLGNHYLFYSTKIVPVFLKSFSPQFLVNAGGAHPWHTLPGWGHLLLPTYLVSLLGSLVLMKLSWRDQRARGLLFLLATALVPAIITVDAPHATRSLTFFVLFALAGLYLLNQLPKKVNKLLLIVFVFSQLLVGATYSYDYFQNFPQKQSLSLMPGFQNTIRRIEQEQPQAAVAIVDPSGFQYILTAWYLQIPAEQFFGSVIKQLPDKIGFRYGQQVTHYHFIAHASDRVASESVLIEWKDNLWQIF